MSERDVRAAVDAAEKVVADSDGSPETALDRELGEDLGLGAHIADDAGPNSDGDGAGAPGGNGGSAPDGSTRSPKGATAATRPRLAPIRWDAMPVASDRRYLVKGLLDASAFSVGYGDAGCGKTFIALDIALHVALGRPWFGRKVRQGLVVYIAAEAGLSIADRLTAFAFHHDIEAAGVPFYVVPDAPDLANDDGDVAALVDLLRELPDPPVLIIVDTLARCMGGRSEDHAEDMGAFISACDQLRTETGAHVLVVHHTGKDKSRGARGSIALRAAADTEFFIERDEATGIVTTTITKQRDMVAGDTFAFKLEVVEIGQDEEEEVVSSCAVVPTEGATTKLPKVTGAAKIALDLLVDAIARDGELPPASSHIPAHKKAVRLELWRSYADKGSITASDKRDTARKAFKRAFDRLKSVGAIGFWNGWVWLADTADSVGQA